MRKVHLYIDGMVTSVGFRTFVQRHANALRIKGYVRNIEGGVEVVAEGEDKQIDELIAYCKEGPSSASVSNVTIQEEVPNYLFKDFAIRP